MITLVVVVLFTALMVGGISWFVIWLVRSSRKQAAAVNVSYENLFRALGVTNPGNFYVPHDVTVRGRRVQAQFFGGGKNSPPMLRLMLPVDPRVTGGRREQGVYRDGAKRRVSGELATLFRKERALDRFGKRIGLNVEHDTGDATFDANVYIESDATRPDLEALLADEITRQAIFQLLERRATNVELFRGASDVRLSLVRPAEMNEALMAELVDKLGVIADNLPAFERSPVGRAAPLRTGIAAGVGMLGGLAAFVFAALSATHWEIVTAGATGRCLLIGVSVWVLLSAVAFVLIRGKSDALRMYSFVLFGGLMGYPALSIGTAATLNAKLDESKPAVHVAKITRRYTTTSKNNTTYHLVLESWRPDRATIEVTVPRDTYVNAIGPSLKVVTRAGWLGWEWIDRSYRYELVQKERNTSP